MYSSRKDFIVEKYAEYNKYNMGEYNVLFISGERYRKTELSTMYTLPGTDSVTSNVEKVLVSNIFALQGEDDRIIQVLTGHEEDTVTMASLKDLYELNGYLFEELLQHPLRRELVELCDVIVDGRYVEAERDLSLHFRGSRNQRIIDVAKSLCGEVCLLEC